ncbi:MAG: uL30 family ribosomal protein, partial [Candidatus Bathyarchaeota archaeon]
MERKCLLAIRIRGGVNASTRVEDTLRMLRLDRNNTSTLLDERTEYKGMLQRAKDYVTWGEPTVETIQLVLEKRGRAVGDSPIDDTTVTALGYDNIASLAMALHS